MATVVTTKTINWGGMLKGAAIVTAVLVAAVVGFYAFNAIAGSTAVTGFFGNETLHAILTGTANTLSSAWDWLAKGAVELGTAAKGMWASLPETLGLSGKLTAGAAAHLTTVTGGATAAQIAGVVGAGIAGSAAIATAAPALHNTNFVDTTTTLATHNANMAQMHNAAHTAQHFAAEHDSEHSAAKTWTNQFTSRAPSASYADSVARKSSASVAIPQNNWSQQIVADTANLNRQLGK